VGPAASTPLTSRKANLVSLQAIVNERKIVEALTDRVSAHSGVLQLSSVPSCRVTAMSEKWTADPGNAKPKAPDLLEHCRMSQPSSSVLAVANSCRDGSEPLVHTQVLYLVLTTRKAPVFRDMAEADRRGRLTCSQNL
jgi:hypothetical protein